MLAVAHEAGVPYDLARIDAISRTTPTLCKVSPSSQYHMEDVDRAGGSPAILAELLKVPGLMKPDCITVTERPLGRIWRGRGRRTRRSSGRCGTPTARKGRSRSSTATSRRRGGVVKTAAVDPKMLVFEGPAVIFESQDEACEGIPEAR